MATKRNSNAGDSRRIAWRAAARFVLTVVIVTGCASRPHVEAIEATDETVSAAAAAANGRKDVGHTVVRKSAMAAQASSLFARSVHIDPILRPISNFLSMSSYALKSATGLVRRTALGTVQFPALEGTPIPALAYAEPMDLAAWEKELDRISGRRQTRGTIEFLIDGEAYFSRLLEAVDQAQESIDIRTYIFDNDDYAIYIADVLKQKSKAVEVRVLVDAFGNMVAMQADPDSLPGDHRGPLHMGRYLEQNSSIRFRSRAIPWITGDHTKTTIIDRKLAFIGGMNIGREYRYDWHDLMMEVTGPVVDHLQYDTDKAWAKASVFGDVAALIAMLDGKDRDSDDHGYPVRVLYTAAHDAEIYKAQLAAIRRSRSYILIENAYFSDDVILYELAKARRRGVDIRVILPSAGNHGSHDLSNLVAIDKMLRNGIRVYLYPGMSHVKAAVFDGWACVGSANFDKLSLEINRELNLATSYQPVVNDLITRLFIADMDRSTEVTEPPDLTVQARLFELVADEAM